MTWAFLSVAIPAAAFAVERPGTPVVFLSLSLLTYVSVIAPDLVWRRMVRDWDEIAASFVDGGQWLHSRTASYSRPGRLLVGCAFLGPLILAGLLIGIPFSWTLALILTTLVPALVSAMLLTATSLKTFWLMQRVEPSELALPDGDLTASPGLRRFAELAKYEAYLGAALFFILLTPGTLVILQTPGTPSPALRLGWACVLLPPIAAVLLCGISAPRWVLNPAHQALELELLEMRTLVRGAWQRWQASEQGGAEHESSAIELSLASAAVAALDS